MVASHCNVYKLVAVIVGPRHLKLKPKLPDVALLAAAVEYVVRWTASLPFRTFENLSFSKTPSFERNPGGW